MRLLLVGLAAFTLLIPIAARAQHGGHAPVGTPPAPQKLPRDVIFQPQESQGAVALTLAPRWSDGRLIVLVGANTHSGNLATIDLGQSVRLIVNGESVAPTTADSLKGHHSRARLVFAVATAPDRFSLEIRGVPDIELRVLAWPAEAPAGH